MRAFFWENVQQIVKFSRRYNAQLEQWCQFEQYSPRDVKKCLDDTLGRYTAINVTDEHEHGTIEIRVFRGTLKYEALMGSLEFCDALAHYVKIASAFSMKWQPFIEWVKRQQRYPNLINYWRERECA